MSAPALVVVVKALKWSRKAPPGHEYDPSCVWAAGIGGHYRAQSDGLLWMAHDAFVWEQHADQKAAKAAAEADHERRVRADVVAFLPAKWAPTWRHRKGGEYQFAGYAKVQTDKPLTDYAQVIIYRAEDGTNWVRPVEEFEDGRFTCIFPASDGQ